VLHIGASRHFREGERKEPPIKGCEDCRDIYTLMETMQIVSRANLLVGIDSGMIHAAVASGLPVVGVFGPTSALLRLPAREDTFGLSADVPCLGCHHRHPRLHWQSGCPHDVRCMKGLTVERVFEKSAQILGN
jgi:ADP-heptose:LPS heptosyltransferase